MKNRFEIRHLGPISKEFEGASFGDKRLGSRLVSMGTLIESKPSESFPKIFGSGAGSEGCYRFLRNERVTFDQILAPHVDQSVIRAKREEVVLSIQDTTEAEFSTEREGLGWLRHSSGMKNGFYVHFALLVAAKVNRPLGVASAEIHVSSGKKKGYRSPATRRKDNDRKTRRWIRTVERVEGRLGKGKAIHVGDREADFFEYFSRCKDLGARHVTRVCRDRSVLEKDMKKSVSLYEKLTHLSVQLERTVALSGRGKSPLPGKRKAHPPRNERLAQLSITATRCELKCTRHNEKDWNRSVELNVVHVFEPNPPQGQPPVDWKLFTTEPIDTQEQIESVVDYYRARWLIEEFNKALKTGCAFEKRQLESKTTLLNSLAIFFPIAYRLLLLRNEERQRPEAPANVVLTRTQIAVLKAVSKMKIPESPSVHDVLYAVSAMGGHLKQNGPPGWQTLGKGLSTLLTLEQGWLAHQRCDQS
jgi:Transposase DNA-binding/Transposase DDE domain